jgi:BirA family biotin operon repressor/biotin-[acetyl-CoA-carboxylase] ligase
MMRPASIETGLPSSLVPEGFRLIRFATIGSTNGEAKTRAEAGAPQGDVIVAEEQTAGHGRRGSDWASPRGNLYSSVILQPDCEPRRAAQLSFVAALSVLDAIRGSLPEAAAIGCKWPNDVLVNRRKICGILLESAATHRGQLDWLVLGVGINIAHHPGLEGAFPSSSLAAEGAHDLAIDRMLNRYLSALRRRYHAWQRDGFAPLRADWLSWAIGRGGPVTVNLEREQLTGRFVDLDLEGALILETEGGSQRQITAGEIFLPHSAGA